MPEPSSSRAPDATATYRPRAATHTVLHELVRQHLATFLQATEARTGGTPLPSFVTRAFEKFLRCGVWSEGLARFQCERCHADRFVPFSCKGRGVCPSCGGRRMAERAATLVDHVLPAVPVRQWVLSLPHRLRYLCAWDHQLCRAVLAVYVRTVLGFLRRRARPRSIVDGRSGAVTAMQRFGGSINLNVHFHTLVLDGVFAPDADGVPQFHPAVPPTDTEIACLLATIVRRVTRLLRRRGLVADEDAPDDDAGNDPLVDDVPALALLSGAAVRGRSIHGRHPGAPVLRVGQQPNAPWVTSRRPHHVRLAAFDLDASRTVRAADRAGLERLCQYLLRPPLAYDRLTLRPDGRVHCQLTHPWADGTHALIMEPLEVLEKLAVQVPRPRVNLVIYHGALAPHVRARAATLQATSIASSPDAAAPPEATPPPRAPRYYAWAQLLQRVFAVDVLQCACGGRLRVIALIHRADAVARILAHLGVPHEDVEPAAARPPPDPDGTCAFAFPD